MIKIATFIHGIYPRSEKLVEMSRGFDRGRFTQKVLAERQRRDFQNLIRLQQKLGFDYLEDGKLSWQDIFRPIITATDGLKAGSLTRWYDTNTFFRQPAFLRKLTLQRKKLDKFFPKIVPSGKWKVTLPSPFTLAKLCKNGTSRSFEYLLSNISNLLFDICAYLKQRGVALIQFNESYLPYTGCQSGDLKLFLTSFKTIRNQNPHLNLAVFLYFGDASSIISSISEKLSVDMVGIDMYQTDLSALPTSLPFALAAGLVDGRNSFLEKETLLIAVVEKLITQYKCKALYLSHNCDLEFLPEAIARKKLELLSDVKKRVIV